MRQIALFICLSAAVCASCKMAPSKPFSPYDNSYYTNVRDFVGFMIHSNRDSVDFLLEDSLTRREFPDGVEKCLKDTLTFTDEERNQIRSWKAHPPFTVWTTNLVPQARLVRSDTIRAIFNKSLEEGWSYFYDHFGPGFNSFGCPLFLRQYTWCLCYSANYCGRLCGTGRLALYKREGNHWIEVKTWGSWIS